MAAGQPPESTTTRASNAAVGFPESGRSSALEGADIINDPNVTMIETGMMNLRSLKELHDWTRWNESKQLSWSQIDDHRH